MGLSPPESLRAGLPPSHPLHDGGEGPAVFVGQLPLAVGAVEHLDDPDVDPEDGAALPLGDLGHLQGEGHELPGDGDRIEDRPTTSQQGVQVLRSLQRQDDPHPIPDGMDGHPGLEGGGVLTVDGEALGTQLDLDGRELGPRLPQLRDVPIQLLDGFVLLQEPFPLLLGPLEPGPHGPDHAGGLLPTALEHSGRQPGISDLRGDLDREERWDLLEIPDDVHEVLTDSLVLEDEDAKVVSPVPVGTEHGESGG